MYPLSGVREKLPQEGAIKIWRAIHLYTQTKKKSELPASYFVLTLRLFYPLDSERTVGKTEAYPGRWTTHIVISDISDLNPELWDWVKQAYEFADCK